MTTTGTFVFNVYSLGICCASVCTSLTDEQATNRLNESHPTGLDHGWSIADEAFQTGESNPCPCNDAPDTHRHILFVC